MNIPVVPKFFNTAGPSQEDIHYTLDPLRRINYEEISLLINQRKYFVLHAPRQTGKTTSLLAMVKKINEEGRYRCVYTNVESAQTERGNAAEAHLIVCDERPGRAWEEKIYCRRENFEGMEIHVRGV